MNAQPRTSTRSEDIRMLDAEVSKLHDQIRMRSPASLFKRVYLGFRTIRQGVTRDNRRHAQLLAIELEGLRGHGHFPQRGAKYDYHAYVETVTEWVREAGAVCATGARPKPPRAVNDALVKLVAYVADYVLLYQDLNGHLPLYGIYHDGERRHPWDNSPWREDPYNNLCDQ